MDVLKNGWHSKSNSSPSSSSSTTGGYRGKLSELKGRATGKPVDKHDWDAARNHQSAPLSSLRDPATFAPPPKHSAYYGAGAQSQAVVRTGSGASSSLPAPRAPSPGLGGPLVETGYAQRRAAEQRERQEQAELEAKSRGPYRVDTSGLRTDHLPPPPVKRVTAVADGGSGSVTAPTRRSSPALPPRVPPRQAAPPPSLPPRQNEYPDEHTPAPPPAYQEAISQPAAQSPSAVGVQQPGTINQFAANRLGQAGVSVAGFGIGGGNSTTTGNSSATSTQSARNYGQQIGQLGALHQRYSNATTTDSGGGSTQTAKNYGQQIGQAAELHQRFSNTNASGTPAAASKGYGQQIGQIGELQQRFSRMNTGNANAPPSSSHAQLAQSTLAGAAAAAQKRPPPAPPKRAALAAPPQSTDASGSGMAPPPLPLSSKPRPS